MKPYERLSLISDDESGHLKRRAWVESLGDFAPKSSARKGMTLDPQATVDKIAGAFTGWEAVWRDWDGPHQQILFRSQGRVLHASLRRGYAHLEVFSGAFDADAVLEALLKLLEPFKFENKEEDGVWADFSYMRRDIIRSTQFLRCPGWDDIRANYAPSLREHLGRLFDMERPWGHGRLIIWHGPPGTGKTYAIRALMMHWRARFSFLVVNDPERLASDPGYYYQVASDSRDVPARHLQRLMAGEGGESDDEGGRRRRCLFILEDTADLILQQSRSTHFDKIGKLLNMTDGLFGQGREDIFLLTFNEDVDKIDPAFLRPGRCIAKIEFPKFAAAEAKEWFRAHGIEESPAGEQTLAEMYARLLGRNGQFPVRTEELGGSGFSRGRRR